MLHNHQQYHRRNSLRLAHFNYSTPGYYHVTVVITGRQSLLGEIENETFIPSQAGMTVIDAWNNLPTHYPWICIDELVIMPDHLHGIIGISDVPERQSLSIAMRKFKSSSALASNQVLGRTGQLWQRGFFDRVIRNERELDGTRAYIRNNPLKEFLFVGQGSSRPPATNSNRIISKSGVQLPQTPLRPDWRGDGAWESRHRLNPGHSYRRRPYASLNVMFARQAVDPPPTGA